MILSYLSYPALHGPASDIYLNAIVEDCLSRGEEPHCSIKVNLTGWLERSDILAVYFDLGIDQGMIDTIESAKRIQKPIEWRWMGGRWNEAPLRYRNEDHYAKDVNVTKNREKFNRWIKGTSQPPQQWR